MYPGATDSCEGFPVSASSSSTPPAWLDRGYRTVAIAISSGALMLPVALVSLLVWTLSSGSLLPPRFPLGVLVALGVVWGGLVVTLEPAYQVIASCYDP